MPSGQSRVYRVAIAYRWRSLPRVRRHGASKSQGSSERMLPSQVTMDQLICTSLSHTHYWYEVGRLKVPANNYCYTYFTINSVLLYARSLRNLLVSGNECGRVFPAGVGPGSPSRDAANWLPSRFSLSVETRRRYGWLRMMVFPGARLFPSPNLVPREGGGTREAGSTVAESLVVLYYRVGTHQIRRRRRAARSLTSQGRAEPLCARITGLNREVSEGKADL